MLVHGFPAAAFGTNCYVLAPGEGEECVVVDPGIGVEGELLDVLRRHRLRPAAVLLTHGHLDHVFAVTPVCGTFGVAATIHSDDRYRLRDPFGTLSPQLAGALAAEFGSLRWQEPDDVVTVADGERLQVAGLDVGVVHAPGHTEGSVMFTLARDGEADLCLSGDVLFAGSIGRTDLPGGDHAAMLRSLRERVLPLDDAVDVLPGHGPATTIGAERAGNPFLRALLEER
ncbi:glyoxylase-like metal-dependent hydrolase (beta-lactamase superfamily II) [Kineococcus xinjiangensis]|uniref:Glyoxylase-like metal-dependent hydrolase (Beta-lactamase superfamily II) n=1 Tax=Kineococcus xinjiangensis TaxID=512762 RepID=A0A2S6INY5_9ACTN|nr:MBL fold metallo-hydrolase [Kineococcus xinjiangensis]PPK95974.1 glyoxylase-like metal-dependent hydrolase (beta-lactamase superfamily II) [Kineococcus xinjiangensis]